MREKFSPSLFQKAGGVWGNAPHKQTDKSKFEALNFTKSKSRFEIKTAF